MPASYVVERPSPRERLAYQLRVLRVLASVEFKLKYVGSTLGYVWSLAKPLSYFAVLWVVFGRFFNTGIEHFPLYLLIGIVLFTFVVDAVGLALPSIVNRGSLLRRISFPPLVIPVSASLTAAMTFGVNIVAVAVFLAAARITPTLEWFLLVPLLLELYAFTLGLGLIAATLFVRLRDIGPIWELTAQLLLFAAPIMYPITILPEWAERLASLNPFVQVLQDVRRVVLGDSEFDQLPGGPLAHAAAVAIGLFTLALGLWIHRREAPRFAESV